MLFLFCVLLVVPCGRCMDCKSFASKTAHVGDDVTLKCGRESSSVGYLFWMKLVVGSLPEILGAAYTFSNGVVKTPPGITAEIERGTFVLRITKAKLSDNAIYYCEEIIELQKRSLNITFLRVKEQKDPLPSTTPEPPAVPVHPGDSDTVQCSILSENNSKMCPEFHKLCVFQTKSGESQATGMCSHDHSGAEKNLPHTCLCNFSLSNISTSDFGIYYCTGVTLEQMCFGNGTKMDTEASRPLSESPTTTVVLFLLCGALAVSLTVIALLIYTIRKKKKCEVSAENITGQQNEQAEEGDLVYTVAHFTKKKTGQRAREQETTIYSNVRALRYE